MNTQREARRDAKEYARAQMYYGEGAGTRRKLITATVESKSERSPEYARVFRSELERQDYADHADKARKERERHDRAEAFNKNTRAIVSGDYRNVQSTILVLIVAGYLAHQTGLDRKIYQKSKDVVADVKAWNRKRKINKVNKTKFKPLD